jgi:hypothetical protein
MLHLAYRKVSSTVGITGAPLAVMFCARDVLSVTSVMRDKGELLSEKIE